jgi:hypothetical protein
MNYLQLVQKLALQVDENEPVTLVNAPTSIRRMASMVNRAYSHLWALMGKRNEDAENETTVTLVDGKAAAPYNRISMVAFGTDEPVRILPWHEFEMHYKRAETILEELPVNAGPTVCAIYKRVIEFYPVPIGTAIATVRGWNAYEDLVSDTDEPVLNEELHSLILEMALQTYMEYENNPQSAAQAAKVLALLSPYKQLRRGHRELPARVLTMDEFNVSDPYLRPYYE